MKLINILIVDDNQIFLTALSSLISSVLGSQLQKIDYATDGSEALEKIKTGSYHYVFMDVNMPNMDGIKASKIACNNYKGFIIIAVSFHKEFEIIREMIEAGARYYINKAELTYQKLERIFNMVFV